MKKVCLTLSFLFEFHLNFGLSLHEMLLNEVRIKEPFFVTNMAASIPPNRLFLWMKAHLIVEHPFVEKPGQFQDNEQSGILSLFTGDGSV